MKKAWTDIVKCPDPDCGADVWVAYYPGYPAKTDGPPEKCHEGAHDDMDVVAECCRCGHIFTRHDINNWCDHLHELYRNHKEHYQEEHHRRHPDE